MKLVINGEVVEVGGGLSQTEADNRYLQLSGGTVTGPLNVQTPTEDTHAATKRYVDGKAGVGGLTFLKKQYCAMDMVRGSIPMGVNFYVYRDGLHGIVVLYNGANIYSSTEPTLPEGQDLVFYRPVDLSASINLVPESEPLEDVSMCLSGQDTTITLISTLDLSTGKFQIGATTNIGAGVPITLPGFARFESDQITFKE